MDLEVRSYRPKYSAHVELYQKLQRKLLNEDKRQQAMWTCPNCQNTIRAIDRHRDKSGHLSKHCGCSVLPTRSMTPDQIANHKRSVVLALKTKYRREAGSVPRIEIAARAKEKREAAELRRAQRLAAVPHDAHVRRYANLLKARLREAKKYAENPQKYRDRQSERKQALVDSYVIYNLKVARVPATSITPELIKLKREAMQYRRIHVSLTTAIKTYWKENNEAISKHS